MVVLVYQMMVSPSSVHYLVNVTEMNMLWSQLIQDSFLYTMPTIAHVIRLIIWANVLHHTLRNYRKMELHVGMLKCIHIDALDTINDAIYYSLRKLRL
jgi:hypothetical protein